MTLIIKKGDLFSSSAGALGHGVNCAGAMGAGIAKTFRDTYPDMYEIYRARCEDGLLAPGDVQAYRVGANRFILNIATQRHPGRHAKVLWVVAGVVAVVNFAERNDIDTLALPWIGCGIGGLEKSEVRAALQEIADSSPVNIEIWEL